MRLRTLPFSLAILAASAVTAMSQSVEDGVTALKSGDYAKAESILTPLVEAGDSDAMRHLAQIHLQGLTAASDPKKARDLLEQAVEAGNTKAAIDLGYLQMAGGSPDELAAARNSFEIAARKDIIEARFMWAKLTIMISREPEELRKAMAEIQLAGAQKYAPALVSIGDFFNTGTFVSKDPKRAIQYYQEAYANGDKASAATVAEMYAFGDLGVVDLPAALKWYETAASAGNAKAAYALAQLIYNDPAASDEDLARAFGYATSAAYAWNEDAQTLLGRMYLEGRATAPDAREAYKWFDLAASAAVLDAHYLRAIAANQIGPETAKSAHDEARKWFDENHKTPHGHRLMTEATHNFN